MKWAIDVAHYDADMLDGSRKPVDWVKAREVGNLSLAIIKSSEGIGYQDPALHIQADAVKGVLPRAFYHFFRSNLSAIQQARDWWGFLQGVNFYTGDFAIIDHETFDGVSGYESLMAMGSCAYEIEKRGIIPLIYTYPDFWKQIGGEKALWAKRYPLALAQWPLDRYILNFPINIFNSSGLEKLKSKVETGALKPVPLLPWDSPAIWQFTSRADSRAIPGHPAVKKVVDYDAVFMNLATGTLPSVPVTPMPTVLKYRAKYRINVRSQANSTSLWLGYLQAGTEVEVDKPDPMNGYIHFVNNLYGPPFGYVFGDYMEKV